MSTSDQPIRLGIVGCGAVTRECHLPALRAASDFRITMLCDRVEKFTRMANLEFGLNVPAVTEVDRLVGNIDAALIAVPPKFHAPIAIQLLEKGIHVLCEKPLATTAADAERMVAAAKANNRVLAVGLMTRFHPNNELLRQVVRDGILGEIREVTAEYGTRLGWSMTSDAYYSKESTGGGVFFDTGIHVIDRVVWLFGEPRDIEYQDDSYGGVESNAALTGKLNFEGCDVPCRMTFSWTHPLSNSIRVIGSQAVAEAKVSDPDTIFIRKELGGAPVEMAVRNPKRSSGLRDQLQVFRNQWSDFAQAIRAGGIPLVSGESAVAPLRLIESAYAVRQRILQPWVEPEAFGL